MAACMSSSLPDPPHMRLVVVVNAWCRSGRKTETRYGITQKRKPMPMLADISVVRGKERPHSNGKLPLTHLRNPT